MSTPTLYPDAVLEGILMASACYPAGFSHALYTQWKGPVRAISTDYLAFLVVPFVAVGTVACALRPDLLPLLTWIHVTWIHGLNVRLILAAILLVPLALGIEYLIGLLLVFFASGGRGPLLRRVTLPSFWSRRLSVADYLLLGLVVVGEEIFYRGLWLGALHTTFGMPIIAALIVSSLAYGLNHLAFGPTSVGTKAVSGALYGGLYLMGHENLLLPILAHGLQNLTLLLATAHQTARQDSQQPPTPASAPDRRAAP